MVPIEEPNDLEHPHYGDPPVYIRQLRAYLSIGTFILSSDPPVLGQIFHSPTASQVRVRIYPLLDTMTWSGQVARITAGEAAGVQEVVQSRDFRTISVQEIQEIAFVFTESEIQKTGVILQGMGNGYVCRMTHGKAELEPGSMYSFPSLLLEHKQLLDTCYAARVFEGIESLRDLMYSKLNSESERQGDVHCRTSLKLNFAPEAWAYLLRRVKSVVNCSDSFSKSIRPRLVGGLVSYSYRIERIGSWIRFATEAQMASLRNVLGSLTICGKRQRRAKLGTNRFLQENDDLNVITTSTESDESKRTNQEGIDFVFNNVELSVYFRYHRYQYTTTSEGEPVHLEATYLNEVLNLARVHESDGDEDDAITEGSLFEWGGRLLKVLEVKDNGVVSAVCLAPPRLARSRIEIEDLHAVSLAIHRYNSIGEDDSE
jgi:hypothetical protein